jgi:EAL domain-containing protein (putative c-di-GMP-specific phosphodiesterase class I)
MTFLSGNLAGGDRPDFPMSLGMANASIRDSSHDIDDFGTGFSSLNYLRRFPINRLKIDQSFVRDIENTPANESITKAIIALAGSLSLEIVAEGIEKTTERAVLENLGCTEGQGYYFAKPLSATDVSHWMETHELVGEGSEAA